MTIKSDRKYLIACISERILSFLKDRFCCAKSLKKFLNWPSLVILFKRLNPGSFGHFSSKEFRCICIVQVAPKSAIRELIDDLEETPLRALVGKFDTAKINLFQAISAAGGHWEASVSKIDPGCICSGHLDNSEFTRLIVFLEMWKC